jgi:hypothetical protein
MWKTDRLFAENVRTRAPAWLFAELLRIAGSTSLSAWMAGGAVEIFNERNVEVVVGASGERRRVSAI